MPRDGITSTFVLRVTRIEVTSGFDGSMFDHWQAKRLLEASVGVIWEVPLLWIFPVHSELWEKWPGKGHGRVTAFPGKVGGDLDDFLGGRPGSVKVLIFLHCLVDSGVGWSLLGHHMRLCGA